MCHHYQQDLNISFERGFNFYGGGFPVSTMVELFFIISGFLTFTAIEKCDDFKNAREFLTKKYLRFLPMLSSTVTVCLILEIVEKRLFDATVEYGVLDYIISVLGIGAWLTDGNLINNPIWYISVLLWCYVLFAVVGLFSSGIGKEDNRRKTVTAAEVLFVCIVALGLFMRWACEFNNVSYPLFNSRISRGLICFFLGVLLKDFADRFELSKSKVAPGIETALVFALLLIYKFNTPLLTGADGTRLYYVLCLLLYPCLVLIFTSDFAAGLSDCKIFSRLGNISYLAFMWHICVLELLKIASYPVSIPFQSRWFMWIYVMITFGVGAIDDLRRRH